MKVIRRSAYFRPRGKALTRWLSCQGCGQSGSGSGSGIIPTEGISPSFLGLAVFPHKVARKDVDV
jgi:hypothetical protein